MTAPHEEQLDLTAYFDQVVADNRTIDVEPIYEAGRGEAEFERAVFTGIDPAMQLYRELADYYAGQGFSELDSDTLRDLDILQRAVHGLSLEQGICHVINAAVERATKTLAYKGSRDDAGLPYLAGAVERALNASPRLIHPAHDALQRAQSELPLFGRPITVYTLGGITMPGKVKAWGSMAPYGRPGLGIQAQVETVAGPELRILDVGHDRFDLTV